MKKKIETIIRALLLVIAIKYIGNISEKGFIDFLLFGFLFLWMRQESFEKDPNRLITLITSVLLSILVIVSKEIYLYHGFLRVLSQWYLFIIRFISISYLFDISLQYLYLLLNRFEFYEKDNTFKKKQIIISIVIMILLYGVCYIAFFPGFYSYDISWQDKMARGLMPFNSHHPIIHTLIWKAFLFIENRTGVKYACIIGYSLFQMAFVIETYYYLLRWEYKNKVSKIFILFTYFYFLLVPVFHTLSFAPTKDIFFACFLLLFLISSIDLWNEKTKRNIAKFILFGILTCLFRNNFIYGLVLFIPIAYFLYKKKYMLISLGLVILLSILSNKLLFTSFHAVKGSIGEMLSVPITQIHDLYKHTDFYTEEERATLKQYITMIDVDYNARLSDAVKGGFNDELYKKDKITFWKLYLKGFLHHPYSYVVSAIDLNVPYLYYNSDYIDPVNGKGYIGTRLFDEEYHSKLPKPLIAIYDYYIKVDNTSIWYMHLPFIKFFFTISFNVYLLIGMIYYCLTKKNNIGLSILIILSLLILTYLLGPIANFRYMYPVYIALPFYILISFPKEIRNKKRVDK
ncbi:MAG: hypothetical protein IJ193_02705 [Bacilli bacterium]|nr:hypothetical protein [Bacilli bacterium]